MFFAHIMKPQPSLVLICWKLSMLFRLFLFRTF